MPLTHGERNDNGQHRKYPVLSSMGDWDNAHRSRLPREITKASAPPIKCQGIKTKLVPFIASNVRWDGRGRWIEPFVGSGAVLFNVRPTCAVVYDTNVHIIALYQAIQVGRINALAVGEYLTREGKTLRARGERHYYMVRERFNDRGDPLDFLFLNRSCFNGMMRFNKKGRFNVPFCRKPDRFRKAYVTRICNQVAWVSRQMQGRDWTFCNADWRVALSDAETADFMYLDPPYVGRHTDYYNAWTEHEASQLAEAVKALRCNWGYSMWIENRYRSNDHVEEHFSSYDVRRVRHFYHVGPTEALRNAMTEGLVVSPGAVTAVASREESASPRQMTMEL